MAKYIPGRTGQQCAQRWRHRVNPDIRKAKWTAEEDRILTRLVHQHGSAWAEISRGLEVCARPLHCGLRFSLVDLQPGASFRLPISGGSGSCHQRAFECAASLALLM